MRQAESARCTTPLTARCACVWSSLRRTGSATHGWPRAALTTRAVLAARSTRSWRTQSASRCRTRWMVTRSTPMSAADITESRGYNIMVTMVYPDPNHEGLSIARLLREWEASGALFTGPRSFTLWSMAVAYALLPAHPNMNPRIVATRRRVTRGSSGRWIVTQTHTQSAADAAIEAADDREARRTGGTFAAHYLGPA